MAQVRQATEADVDHVLGRAVAAWEALPDVEREIDGWDLIDQIVFLEEWPIEEDRLLWLAEHVRAGDFTEAQSTRYRDLLKVVDRHRPIIERLMRS